VTDFDDLIYRAAKGELGVPNLAMMIVEERARNATLVDALKEWQVLAGAAEAIVAVNYPAGHGVRSKYNDIIELVLWLALPWGDNDPLFPESDGWTPRALEANSRMKATWIDIVRSNRIALTKSTGAVPDEEGNKDGI
jgi:hypothetical protein